MTQDKNTTASKKSKQTTPVLILEDEIATLSSQSITTSPREAELLSRIEKLETINQALIGRVERSMDQRANSYSLFQSAILLEEQVRARTMELRNALSELETTNKHLSKAKEQAEQSNSSKTKFLAAASHDLLQPLSAARLNMSALSAEKVSPQAASIISKIDRSLITIQELLRTLFDISKLDAGVSVPDICRFPAERILRGLHTDFNTIAQQKGLKLKIVSLPVIVDTDPIFLRRILQNLISNAVRYTKKGGVLMGARRRGDNLIFEVWDTGLGIPTHEYDRIFDEFHRVRNDEHHDGLGLGLAIVTRMAKATGHTISFSSEVGKGSVFRVTVPISYKQTNQIEKPLPLAPTKPSLLKLEDAFIVLIEDDPNVRGAMKTLLTRWGAYCVTADSLGEVIKKLDLVERIPDLIIADYNLTDEIVGPTVVKEIRKRYASYYRPIIPSVIVSATPTDKVIEDAANEKCEFLTKPVEPAELRALLVHLLNE